MQSSLKHSRFASRYNRSEEKQNKRKKNSNGCNICILVMGLLLVATASFFVVYFMSNKDTGLSVIIKDIFKNSQIHSLVTVAPVTVQVPATSVAPHFTAKPIQSSPSKPLVKFNPNKNEIHFIHIPKCGGTTMTSILRQIQCARDPQKNSDCCLNPGFCDWHAHRRCAAIQGCINHFPNRKLIFKPTPSIAVFREPISRILSAWFYRGHSPNLDFFQVRPEFKEIAQGLRPKATFAEYVEMHEYHNIQTRMLGADSFPYRNITVTEEVQTPCILSMRIVLHSSTIGLSGVPEGGGGGGGAFLRGPAGGVRGHLSGAGARDECDGAAGHEGGARQRQRGHQTAEERHSRGREAHAAAARGQPVRSAALQTW